MDATDECVFNCSPKGEEFVDFAFPEESELKVEKPCFFDFER